MQDVDICFSLDSNYVEQFCVSAVSILKNSLENEKINFYILDGGLTQKDKDSIQQLKNIKDFNIQYLEINNEDFNFCPMLNDKDEKYKNYHVSKPTYYRFTLPTLLPNLDKILYFDCDVIVRNSLKDLYNKDLNGKACCMCLDVESKKEAKRLGLKQYFNAGIILINLDYWRKNNIESKLFDYAKNNADKILWQDQDILNCVLDGKIEAISNKWNYQYFLYEKIRDKELYSCVILHLAGRFKPWLMPFEHFVYDIYYFYLFLTPYKNKILEYKEKSSGKYLKNNIGGANTNIQTLVFDNDIQKVYEEITKNYSYTTETKNVLNAQIDVKSVEIIEYLSSKVDGNTNLIEINKNSINAETDEKISKVYEEITKNYDYTNNIRDNLTSKLDEETSKNQHNISEVKNYTDNKIAEINENISNQDREQTRQNDLKNSEIYAYTNSELLKLLNRLNLYDKNLQEKIELKSFEAYKWFEENKNEINRLKEVLNSKIDIELLTNIENKLLEIEENHQKQMENVLLTFDEKLNEQRLKYENKLIKMEKLINKLEEKYNEDKKSFFKKIVDKIKKR